MKTILVVDELLYCRQLLAFALRRNGYDVAAAEDGIGAVDALKKGAVDLVILETHLPRMDGLSVLRIMRANPDWAHLPVFMLTGAENRNQIVQAMQIGVQAYLLKSQFDLESLLVRIEKSFGPPGKVGTQSIETLEMQPIEPATRIGSVVEIEGDIEEAAGFGRR